MSNNHSVYHLHGLVRGSVVHRPSKNIKSPYVADVMLDSGEMVLAHSASLGCNGLANAGARVYLQSTPGNKCAYKICLSEKDGVVIGIYPKYAEEIVVTTLIGGWILGGGVQKYKRECVMKVDGCVDSRFDFSGVDANGREFVLEVKTVPLATTRGDGTLVGYFPDGFRKKKSDPVSPRALKHVRELEWLKTHTNKRCVLCFVVQRDDVRGFMCSDEDPEYKLAVAAAAEHGVEVLALRIGWNLADCGGGLWNAEAVLYDEYLQVYL